MRKTTIAIVLSACLLLTLWPAAVFGAEGTNVPGKGLAVAVEGGNIYFDSGAGTVTECDDGVTAAVIPRDVNGYAVVKIGDSAFSGKKNLKRVTLPEGLKNIGKQAFASCEGLSEVEIPASVETIGENAFQSCLNLQSISVSENNYFFTGSGGVLFDKEKDRLLAYPAGKADAVYRIPEGVTKIGNGAFADTKNLQTLYLPDTMDSLEDRDLENASSLTKVVLPDDLLVIGDAVFSGCKNLRSLEIPDSVVSIGDKAFQDCAQLQKIALPESVVLLGENAFTGCSALESIAVSSANRRFASRNGVLYNKAVTKLIQYPAASAAANYQIPDTVRETSPDAFTGTKNLKSLVLPKAMKTVPANSFLKISGLTEVTFPQGVERIDGFAFSENDGLERIMITAGTVLIDKSAFADCPKLKDVYFSGTQAQWQSACKWPAAEPYTGIRIHYNTVPGLPMDDIEQGRWSANDIAYVYQKGLMKGTAAGVFEPGTQTTRAMIVTILHRMEGEPYGPTEGWFWDVPADSYYGRAVRWAASQGIVNGVGEGTFAPDNGITREQLVVILYRYADYNGEVKRSGGIIDPTRFSDAGTVSDYAVQAMAWAIENGLINGNDGWIFPQSTATREQVAAILHRFCEL